MLSLKALVRPKTAAETFLASLLLWNPAVAGAFTFVFGGTYDFGRRWLIALVISDVVGVQCFLAASLVRWAELAYYRRKGRSHPGRSIGFYFFVSLAIMPFALWLGFAAGSGMARLVGVEMDPPDFQSYRIGIAFGLVMASLYFFQRTRLQARDAAREAAARIGELENRRLQAQLSALTAEMNPHLLFNALNTVASLIHQDPDRAEDVVVQLAELYRGVLRSSGSATHALHDELRLCEAYLQVEHARFGDRLEIDIDVDRAIDTRAFQVPVLVLQPFVENAIKHGFAHRARGGKVRLQVTRTGDVLDVVVEDDGVGFGHSAHEGAGKAIANCKERLALTYGTRANLEVAARTGGGTLVMVSLPTSLGV